MNTFSKNLIANQRQYLYLSTNVIFWIFISLFLPKAIIAENTSLIQSQINVLSNKADQAYISGNYQQAVSIWLKIVKEQKPESNQLATVYSNLASVYWHLGKPGEAIQYWQQAIKIYRQTDNSPAKLAATLTDTARAYNDLGQPHFSIPLLTEALTLASKKELIKVNNVAYLALGNAYTIKGNYAAAINAYQKSLNNIEQGNSNLPIVVWNNLSQAYQQQAITTEQKAIASAKEGDLSAGKLWQQVKSDRTQAWQAAKRATSIRENSHSIARVEALLQLAKLAKNDATKSSQAVDSLLKAEVILSTLPDSYDKVYALIELGKLTDDYDLRSKSILNSAVKIAQKINNPRVASFAKGAMGKHYESQQQYDKALYWTQQAQFSAQQAQAPDSLYQWDWQAARIYHATDRIDAAIESYERAISSLQSIGSNTTKSQRDLLIDFQAGIEPIYRGLIKLLLTNNSDQTNLKQVLETKDLLLLSELENFFADDCFKLKAYSEADRVSYLQQTKTAVINTIILDNKTYLIWQFSDGQYKKYTINISQNQLEKLVTQWRFNLENKENDNYLALSQQLYKLFFPSEIKSYLKTLKLENLVFINDGILRNVPMTSLHDGQKFLIEDYAVTNSLSLNIRSKQPISKIEKALAFGLTTGGNQFPPLPYVKQEIEKLGKLLDEKQFLNNQFSYKTFKQQVESSKFSIVHIATHGRFGGTSENTYLQAYQSQISLQELEETLSVHNARFPDNPIQLLVLSACSTAASNPRATLGMSGVAVRTGVSNVLGSLWAVNDRQIVSLIDNFYKYWLRDNLSQSEALRQAQLDLIKSPNYHPSNWSSLILLQS